MDLEDQDGNPIPVSLLGAAISDPVCLGLGWALYYPAETVIERTGSKKNYRVRVEGRGEVSPDIAMDIMAALLKLKMINPSAQDATKAVGNPLFLRENPEWRIYIPDPKRRR